MKTDDPVIIRSPRRKRIAFAMSPEGALKILAPPGVSEKRLLEIAAENPLVIERLRRRAERESLRRRVPTFVAGEEFYLWGKLYPLRFSRRVTAFDAAFILPAGTPDEVFSELREFYRAALRRYVERRLREFAAATGAKFERIRISGAETRWGSCSSNGTISFSWKLAQCPITLVDYVIWHELTHLSEMNHSPRFWALLESRLPGARRLRSELRSFERTLPRFPN